VIVGDSLSVGEFASARHLTCTALVLEWAVTALGGSPSSQVVALSGGRAADLLRRRPPAARRLAIVQVGTNDWLGYRRSGPWEPTPLGEFRTTYARLLGRVAGLAGPVLLCLGVWAPPGADADAALSRSDLYDEAIRGVCAAAGGCFISLADIANDPVTHGPSGRRTPFGISDAGHPNDCGHDHLAAATIRAASALSHAARPAVSWLRPPGRPPG
jgi:lysophospholipase L1-like esterase